MILEEEKGIERGNGRTFVKLAAYDNGEEVAGFEVVSWVLKSGLGLGPEPACESGFEVPCFVTE